MLNKIKSIIFISALLISVTAQIVLADKYTVELGTEEFNTVSPNDTTLGNYYVAKVELPNVIEGKELFRAILELTVDVAAKEIEGFTNETPMFEVYALTADMEGDLDPSKFKKPTPTRRNVRLGNDRHIRLDITNTIKDFIINPGNNHGLVLGSLSNSRDGLFSVKSSKGTLATITYYYTTKK